MKNPVTVNRCTIDVGSMQDLKSQIFPVQMYETLEQIYLDHRQGLFSLALSITRSHQLAEDSVHNAFTNLFPRKLPPGDQVAYVYKAVRNSAIDAVRANNRRSKLSDSLFVNDESIRSIDSAHDTLVSQERANLLQQAIDELDDQHREAIVLRSFAGLTFDQAATITNTPAKTVATRFRRALQKLEQKLRGRL